MKKLFILVSYFAFLLFLGTCEGDTLAEDGQRQLSASQEKLADNLLQQFDQSVKQVLIESCFDCHNEDYNEAGVKLDSFDPDMLRGHDAEKWHAALDMINSGEMPPDDDYKPSDDDRRMLVEWITKSLDASRELVSSEDNQQLRRLTKKQYANTLRDLLHLPIEFGSDLPEDSPSSLGFRNSSKSQQTTSLHLQYYETTARQAIGKAIVKGDKPEPFRIRTSLGLQKGIDGHAAEIGGFQSMPINSDHFLVEVLDQFGHPKIPKSEEEHEELLKIESNIGLDMRGSSNDRFRVVEEGMILNSALPHKEVSPKSWQGPSPNLKMLLRKQAPTTGPFRLSVKASRANPRDSMPTGLLSLRETSPVLQLENLSSQLQEPDRIALLATDFQEDQNIKLAGTILAAKDVTKNSKASAQFTVEKAGIYQIDLVHPIKNAAAMPSIALRINDSSEHVRLSNFGPGDSNELAISPVAHANFEEGTYSLRVGGRFFSGLSHLVFTKLPDDHPVVDELKNRSGYNASKFENAIPSLQAFIGTRTDDGMEYSTFGESISVENFEESSRTFEYYDYLENLPCPTYDDSDKGALSNIMIVGVWNDYLVKKRRDRGPPLLIEEIEFEVPYYPVWPPESHLAIFFEDPLRDTDLKKYTYVLLQRFMERAYRRPVTSEEVDRYYRFWLDVRDDFEFYEDAVGEALVAVLCSPNFLYLEQRNDTVKESHQLATNLSYFLWNSPPSGWLKELAREGRLESQLDSIVPRMLDDPKAKRFADTFAEEWLRLDRHQAMKINPQAYPDYSRFVKQDMRNETLYFFHHVLSHNLSARVLIDSDFAFLNQNLAEFYGVKGVNGTHFRFVPLAQSSERGGLLSQGAFLAGHSDGTQSHPIKRAVWLKEHILGSPPPPPPPNVPELDPDTPGFDKLTLKEQLEMHRDKSSCMDCHRKIDPYGIPFEEYDAVGRLRREANGKLVDKASELPDGTRVSGVAELKRHILQDNYDTFVTSICEHLFSYATGREITYLDQPEIDLLVEVAKKDDRLGSIVLQVVKSNTFLRKPISESNENESK